MTRHPSPHHPSHENRQPESGSPKHPAPATPPGVPSGSLHSWMMTACLVLMGGAMLLLMWRGQSLTSGAWLLLPIALCLGMHFLLHRYHGHRGDD